MKNYGGARHPFALKLDAAGNGNHLLALIASAAGHNEQDKRPTREQTV